MNKTQPPSRLTHSDRATEPTRAAGRPDPLRANRSTPPTLTPTHLTASAGSPEWHFWQAERRRVHVQQLITRHGGLRPALLASGRPAALRALRALLRQDVDRIKAEQRVEADRRRIETTNRLVREWRAGQLRAAAPKALTTQIRAVNQNRQF